MRTNNKTMRNIVKNTVAAIAVIAMFIALAPAQSFAYSPSKANNAAMIGALPTSGVSVSVPLQGGVCEFNNKEGATIGYQIFQDLGFKEAKATTKSGIKAKAVELTRGKNSNYDKAKEIHAFVKNHMRYYGHFINVDGAWERGIGNCETYAILTSALLYYAGIPNAYAHTGRHMFNLILCDGRWVPCDSQSYFDGNMKSDYPAIKVIVFRNEKLSYVVDDLSGLKLADIGVEHAETDNAVVKSGITIPAYVTGYYTKWKYYYPNITIRGTRGTAGEALANELNYKCVHYSGEKFAAHRTHKAMNKTTKPATHFASGKAVITCKNCSKFMGNSVLAKKKLARPSVSYKGGKKKINIRYTYKKGTTGFQVAYKKAGSKKYKTKNFNSRKSATKVIKKLKRGKYTVKVRAYVKSCGKYAFSNWTKARSVRVR